MIHGLTVKTTMLNIFKFLDILICTEIYQALDLKEGGGVGIYISLKLKWKHAKIFRLI